MSFVFEPVKHVIQSLSSKFYQFKIKNLHVTDFFSKKEGIYLVLRYCQFAKYFCQGYKIRISDFL